MKEWDVYDNGVYLGTVYADTEQEARLAAFYKYEIFDGSDVRVNKR